MKATPLLLFVLFLLLFGCIGIDQDIEQTFNEDGSSVVVIEIKNNLKGLSEASGTYSGLVSPYSMDLDGFFAVDELLFCDFLKESGYSCSLDEELSKIRIEANLSEGYGISTYFDLLAGKQVMEVKVDRVALKPKKRITGEQYLKEAEKKVDSYISEFGEVIFCGPAGYMWCQNVSSIGEGKYNVSVLSNLMHGRTPISYACIEGEEDYLLPLNLEYKTYNTSSEAEAALLEELPSLELKQISSFDGKNLIVDCGEPPFSVILLKSEEGIFTEGVEYGFDTFSVVSLSASIKELFRGAVDDSQGGKSSALLELSSVKDAMIPSYAFAVRDSGYTAIDFKEKKVMGVPFSIYSNSSGLGHISYLKIQDMFDFTYTARLPEGYKITSVASRGEDLTELASGNELTITPEDVENLKGAISITAEKQVYPEFLVPGLGVVVLALLGYKIFMRKAL